MSKAIAGLILNAAKGDEGFRVVGADRNACPAHHGIFPALADAEAYAASVNAEFAAAYGGTIALRVKVVPFKVR